jgi:hypothetical protein
VVGATQPPEHDLGAFVCGVRRGAALADSSDADTVRSAPSVWSTCGTATLIQPYRSPFDVFAVRLQTSAGTINQLRASGRLFGKDLNGPTARHRHQFGVNQRYDFVKNPAYQFGGQSIEAGVHSRWHLRGSFGIRTQAFVDAILLAALDAPNSGVGERIYDFGPGGGFRLEVALERRGITYVTLYGRNEFVHTVSGASADHVVNFSGLEITVPIAWGLGVALHSSTTPAPAGTATSRR